MTTNVKFFRFDDTGAPAQIAQTAGQMLAILDAILINGYNSKTITITRNLEVATASCVGHGFRDGACLLIAGANESGYNGEKYITRIDADTFTFPVSALLASPATGTITAKVAPAGWTKPFTGTNKAVYRQGSGNMRYMRINDATSGQGTAQSGRIMGFESMTDVDAGSGQFPAQTQVPDGLYFYRSSDSNARNWMAVATDRHLFMWVNNNGNTNGTYCTAWYFGDLKPRNPADPYATMIIAPTNNGSDHGRFTTQAQVRNGAGVLGHYFPRSYTGVGNAVLAAKFGDCSFDSSTSGYIGAVGAAYPNPADGSLLMAPVTAFEPLTYCIRGMIPGLWAPLHGYALNQHDTLSGTGDLAGKSFMCLFSSYSSLAFGQFLLETSNTWDL